VCSLAFRCHAQVGSWCLTCHDRASFGAAVPSTARSSPSQMIPIRFWRLLVETGDGRFVKLKNGFTAFTKREAMAAIRGLERKKCPFTSLRDIDVLDEAVWVKPVRRVEVDRRMDGGLPLRRASFRAFSNARTSNPGATRSVRNRLVIRDSGSVPVYPRAVCALTRDTRQPVRSRKGIERSLQWHRDINRRSARTC